MKKSINIRVAIVLSMIAMSGLFFISCNKDDDNFTGGSKSDLNASSQRLATVNYSYILGEEPVEGPDESSAPNGDVLVLTGSGTLSIYPKSVSGGGTFEHHNAAGVVKGTGTWSATQLTSFVSYGNDPTLPPELEGGKSIMQIHLTPSSGGPGFNGILQVHCLIGNFPAGAHEGVRLEVQGIINFNHEVEGETVFIRQ